MSKTLCSVCNTQESMPKTHLYYITYVTSALCILVSADTRPVDSPHECHKTHLKVYLSLSIGHTVISRVALSWGNCVNSLTAT